MGKNEIPEGTIDLINEQCEVREALILKTNDLFRKWSYQEVITPTIEYYDIINNNSQSFKQEDMYKFFDNKGRIMVLRPDMTIPIARVVGSKLKNSELPLRLRYTSNIFRVNESLVGKRNESTHCGVELMGQNSYVSDLEMIILAIETLKEANIKGFKLEIGHIGIFNDIFEIGNFDEDIKEKLAALIEEKKIKELEDLLEALAIDDKYKKLIKKLPWLFGDKEVLKNNEGLYGERIDYLNNLAENLEKLGYGDFISFDLGMVPRISYYTGVIFRGYVKGYGNFVLQGGRYDNLLKNYGRDLPAVGFSLNIDSLVEVCDTENFIKENDKVTLEYEGGDFINVMKKAEELRKQGKSVAINLKRGEI